MENNIKVSVIIPVWNQEELIVRALDSIPKRKDIEVVVINDASTDNTLKSVNAFAKKHREEFGRFYISSNKTNRGVGYTVNRGYDNATGEYVIALGSDDYFYTDRFEQMMEYLDGTDMVYYNLEVNDGSVWDVNPNTKVHLCGSTKFMRREFLGDTRCSDKRVAEDYDLYIALLKKNPTERFTGIPMKHYNFPREGSLMYLSSKK